jgi:hypothetical protein
MPPKKRRKLRSKLPNPQNLTTVLRVKRARLRPIMNRKKSLMPS